MRDDRIDMAVQSCLNAAAASKRPFTAVGAFLQSLKDDPSWTPGDIIELQTRVIRQLMMRAESEGHSEVASRSSPASPP
jgi:hypothetical protein